MADDSTQKEDPLLMAAREGHLGPQIGRVVCMTHAKSRRVRSGLEHLDDDAGGAPTVGAWKRGRSS